DLQRERVAAGGIVEGDDGDVAVTLEPNSGVLVIHGPSFARRGQNALMEYLPSTEVGAIRARLDHPIIDADGHAIEYLPLVRDILREQAGDNAVAAMDLVTGGAALSRALTPEQLRAAGLTRTSWWGLPTRNTLDRGTALLPDLLAARLPELGID